APSAKGDDKFITTDYLQQCPRNYKSIICLSTNLIVRSGRKSFFLELHLTFLWCPNWQRLQNL
ncbi:hypothetical protein, partial [Serratia marcescens]|uniref:hypothetical protein n=1 Tax=Serratia marcescens TaxID=615 RepID=UPI001F1531AD